MMRVNPYLSFNGQCESAFQLYETCLGGKTVFRMTYGESPTAEQTPPDWREKIYHATFESGDLVLSGADTLPGQYQKPQGISLMLSLNDVVEADRIFHALAEGGEVGMPFQATFWSKGFGVLVDQFGTPWIINCG